MVAVLCASVEMQPYDQVPGLENMCSIFMYNPNDFYFYRVIMHVEKEIIKKRHNVICSHVWVWRRPSHCNAHT